MSDPAEGSRWVVRPATTADAAAVVGLEVVSLGADAWSETLVVAGITGSLPTVAYLVAERDRAVAGYAVVSLAGDVAELQRVAVDPSRRRVGIGRALVAAAVSYGDAGGADRLLLEVREDNEVALALYAGSGFTEIDRRRRYYRDGATAVVLQRLLGVDADPFG